MVAITFTSTGISRRASRRVSTPCFITCSSADCSSGARYSIFSRNSVPPLASSRRLRRPFSSSVGALPIKSWPSTLSAYSWQLTEIYGPGARSLSLWIAWLSNSLPTPSSPHSSTGKAPRAAWRPKWISLRVSGSSADICSKVWLTLPNWLVIN